MKAKVFFLTIVLAFSQFSFSNNFIGVKQEMSIDEKSRDTLYIMGSGYEDVNDGASVPFPPEFVFSGEDIISFNLTTREVVLADPASIKFIPKYNSWKFYHLLSFYLNDILFFENVTVSLPIDSNPVNDLVFYCDRDVNYRFYLNDGYPAIIKDSWPEEIKEIFIKEREANAEKRKEGWDIFINYLRDNGKIVGDNTNVEPVATTESNAVSMYPNPTTGELKIENGELKIENVELFDIHCRKIFNFQLSTFNSFDISHLPAGIYFVKITTEKGVVMKKVVKR